MAEYLKTPYGVKVNFETGALDDYDNMYDRRLSNMAAMYEDQMEVRRLLAEDPVIYRVYEKKLPELPGELQWCTSITYPGKIGREYYMTKGHFHAVRETAEIYLCLRGEGYMLMMTDFGDWKAERFEPQRMVYVPAGWAHRTVNTGEVPLISFCVYPGPAGHDYGSIESSGFARRVVEVNGKPEFVA